MMETEEHSSVCSCKPVHGLCVKGMSARRR